MDSLIVWARHPPILLTNQSEKSQRGPTHIGYDGKIFCTKELLLTSKMASALRKVLKQSVALLKVF